MTLKKVFATLIIFFLVFHFDINAQIVIKEDTTVNGWKTGGFFAFNVNQVALINWAAGGESALSSTFIFNAFAKYRKNNTYFESILDAGFGFITTKSQSLRKNEDKLELNINAGKKAKGKFYYAGMLNFRTQFAPGYDFPNDTVIISRLLAPGFLSLAVGFNYKPNDWFSAFISPATGRATFVFDQNLANAGQFGVDKADYDANGNLVTKGKNVRWELGAYVRARLQKDIAKNISVVSNLQLFNNYTDPIKKQRGNIDVNWENLILIKANKWLTTSIFTNLIYDNDVAVPIRATVNGVEQIVGKGPRTQFKEALGIGLSFKF
jgi:hypothetical protein